MKFLNLHRKPNEDGTTLTEALVALALLMVVVMPTIGLLGLLSGNQLVEQHARALNYAQHTMENALIYKNYSDSVFTPRTGWEVQRSVEHGRNLITIDVRVFKTNSTEPVIRLTTSRLARISHNVSSR